MELLEEISEDLRRSVDVLKKDTRCNENSEKIMKDKKKKDSCQQPKGSGFPTIQLANPRFGGTLCFLTLFTKVCVTHGQLIMLLSGPYHFLLIVGKCKNCRYSQINKPYFGNGIQMNHWSFRKINNLQETSEELLTQAPSRPLKAALDSNKDQRSCNVSYPVRFSVVPQVHAGDDPAVWGRLAAPQWSVQALSFHTLQHLQSPWPCNLVDQPETAPVTLVQNWTQQNTPDLLLGVIIWFFFSRLIISSKWVDRHKVTWDKRRKWMLLTFTPWFIYVFFFFFTVSSSWFKYPGMKALSWQTICHVPLS